MADARRETWITGLGIISCLGEGPEMHWHGLNEPPPLPDTTSFSPYPVHPMAPLELDKQIPKKDDQRQMDAWQRIGVYAAGLALDSAGAKGNADLLARMDMIVAASGGERDETVDEAILSGLPKAERPEAFINERLMSDLRPTLFLTQLSNLLAGNISIVHGVTGSSRTFMGEEAAGVDAVRIALARIEAGQSDIVLVGGAHNGERRDVLLVYAAGGIRVEGRLRAGVGAQNARRRHSAGVARCFPHPGSFPARRRPRRQAAGAPLGGAVPPRPAERDGGALSRHVAELAPRLTPGHAAVISGATGAEPVTSEERAWLETLPDIPVRASGTYIGHGSEPQFAMNIALATLALSHEKMFPPADSSGVERPMPSVPHQIVVTGVGQWRGEGMALVEAVR